MSQTFRDRVVATGLPLDQIIVIGSGILDALHIRETDDIDVAASHALFEQLKADATWHSQIAEWGEEYLEKADCEVWRGWVMDDSGHPTYEDLLHDTQLVDGIRYISLEYLLAWKKRYARPKDIKDIKLIEESGYVGKK